MKPSKLSVLVAPGLAFAIIMLPAAATRADGDRDREIHLISQSAMLTGLPAGMIFPFIDTTPSRIRRAHIAVTDSTADCTAGAAPPDNVQILVGEAGVELVAVLTAESNTGISTTPGQCVFHVTVRAGDGDIPKTVTDIVVLNSGSAPLGAANTITASADVVLRNRGGGHGH